ncbi:LysR substrate-binding domain-containing protein [Pseudoteredinibacter isoporae]|uniref:LysR family glycine cleavage system transcriptional activator n=1 Tax=Pseudoteredinibacter isoporae TaxID=570281 RepID=A0A7X0MVT8_9GAMM|nr:LysR substrate-binding domain-containing protein [Pseudoteredinibacter isoporae]MBB6521748.1 LysR family glycine cleavage system transcriptional activator [Pseudoteredinibacter isoporae]NHO87296.1 LysR family transcriptional regulator [Pseudoteredinibacter isoporae]NIB23072.1 LysR family transcriptional regulator [Pseudoteredinibacter isoporae]
MKSPTHLNALRAFEATARLGSFKAAADEIGVTPEAVGQLVRTLESYLDIQLFHRGRGGKRLTPTKEALEVLPSLSEAFRSLVSITDTLKGLSRSNVVTLSSSPSVMAKWLLQLLPSFLSENPELDVRLDMTDRVLDVSAGEADIAIRYGQEVSSAGLDVIELVRDEKLFPVCCPRLLEEHPEVTGLDGLLRQTLIRDATMKNPRYPGWSEWFEKAANTNGNGEKVNRKKVSNARLEAGHYLEVNASLAAIEMAKMSQGVALAREYLVRSEIANGSLVNLYPDCAISTSWNYYIVTRKDSGENVERFARWLKENLSQHL